jgi:polar amino acid transport system permease protein
VTSGELTGFVPPGDSRRRAVRFRGNLPLACTAAIASVAIAVGMVAMVVNFENSLNLDGVHNVVMFGRRNDINPIVHGVLYVVEALIVALTLAVPWYGIRALLVSLRAQRLAKQGEYYEARLDLETARERMWVVVGLGLSALVVAFVLFLMAGNNGKVRDVLFDWSLIWRSRSGLLRGFWINIKLFTVAGIIVVFWALLVAVVRMLPGRACAPIRALAIIYTDVFRGMPAIITIFLIVFGFPLAGVPVFDSMGKSNQVFWLSVLALVMIYGAYVAEVYRAGLESVHWSQAAAARSLGLSQAQTLRFVVIPQAVRRIIPPLLNDFIALQKDTALVSFVGVLEILNYANLYKNRYFNLSPVMGAAIAYLIITIPLTRFVDYLIRIDRERTQAQ